MIEIKFYSILFYSWLNLRWVKCHLTQSDVSQVSSDSIWCESSVIWLNLRWVKCHLTQSEVSQLSSDSIWGESSVIWLNLRWVKCHLTQSEVSQVSSDSIWGESSVIWLNLRWAKCHLTQSEVSQVSSDSIWGESSVIWLILRWAKCHLTQSVVSQVSSGSIWGESSVIWLNLRWVKCQPTQSELSQVSSDLIWGESSVIWLILRWAKCHLTQSEVSQVPSGSIWGKLSAIWLNLWWVKCHLTKKANFIIFTPIGKKYNIREADININGSKIKHVKCTKFLGITIDEHLAWKIHVDNLSNKIARNVGMLNKLKHFLPDYIMKTLYSSLIASHLQYCTLLWANSHVTHIRKLQLLQKKTIRIITSSHYIAYTDPLFAMTKLLKIEDLYKYQLGIFMHKVTHSQLPQNMSSMFLRTDKIHSHKPRNQNAYFIQQIRTNTRKSTINFSGPTFWNTLPINLRQIVSIHLFKKKFKELLQSKYP